jgi:hypothetical protein
VQEPVVVVSWPSVPVEIVRAAGFHVAIARGSSGDTPVADQHLEPGIFPSRLRHLVERALTGRLAGAARLVVPRTSDADYTCFLYLREFVRQGMAPALPPVILFDLLQSGGAAVRAYDAARMRQLFDELASAAGRTPSLDVLRREIVRANAARAAARRLARLRRGVPRATGAEIFPLLAAFWERDPEEYVASADAAASAMAARSVLPGPRVLLAGAPADGPEPHAAIESHGAVVVAEVGPWAQGAAGDDVRVDHDPFAALADKYRADAVGPRTPIAALRAWTERVLDEVDAVVVWLPPDDTVFGWDYPWLRELLQARGLPHVCLRGRHDAPPAAAERARLEAMLAAASRLHEVRHG